MQREPPARHGDAEAVVPVRGKTHGPYLVRLWHAHERLEKAKAAMKVAHDELVAASTEYAAADQELERMKKEHP